MRERRQPTRNRFTTFHASALLCTSLACGIAVLFSSSAEELKVGVPLVVMVITAIAFWCVLGLREGEVPVFELGSMFMLAMALYLILPLLTYLLSGMEYSEHSSFRLQEFRPDASKMGTIAWEQWSLMASFAICYLITRGKLPRVSSRPVVPASLSVGAALALMWLGLLLWTQFLRYRFGVDYRAGYGTMSVHLEGVASLPHWMKQLIGVGVGLESVVPIALFVFLLSRWRTGTARALALLVLSYTLISYVFFNMGARTWLFLPFAAASLMYFRNVRRLRLWMAVCGIVLAMTAFWAFDAMRAGATLSEKVGNLKSVAEDVDRTERFTRKDEFQIWLSSNVEVRELRNANLLPPVPWQIYAIDILLFIPSQLLPFEKVDPVTWFTNVETTRTGRFEFFLFSPIGQGYLGFGVPEIIVRGLFLGALFALTHRAYVRRSSGFLSTVVYLWFILFCYTSLRNNTGYVFVIAMQRLVVFIPVLFVLTRILELGWGGLGKVRRVSIRVTRRVRDRHVSRSVS